MSGYCFTGSHPGFVPASFHSKAVTWTREEPAKCRTSRFPTPWDTKLREALQVFQSSTLPTTAPHLPLIPSLSFSLLHRIHTRKTKLPASWVFKRKRFKLSLALACFLPSYDGCTRQGTTCQQVAVYSATKLTCLKNTQLQKNLSVLRFLETMNFDDRSASVTREAFLATVYERATHT